VINAAKFIVDSLPHGFLLCKGQLQGGRKQNRNLHGKLLAKGIVSERRKREENYELPRGQLERRRAMSYHVPNWGSIAGGATTFVAYTLAGGTENRAQFAEAIPQNANASIVSFNHTVQQAPQGRFTYFFWIREETGTPTSYTLSGGGCT
jgi:hypothetical protein